MRVSRAAQFNKAPIINREQLGSRVRSAACNQCDNRAFDVGDDWIHVVI
jgi:hypothetical protein